MEPTLPRPSPHQINAFAHTVREGSVSAAARKLGVTQGAVSQHLKKLEDAAGAKLLLQSRDGMTLTRTGEELYALADGFLAAERMIAEKLSDLTQLKRGNLSIIANAPQPAMSIIAQFCQVFPGVQIEFSLHDWTTSMRLLNGRTVDIGIVTAPRDSSDFIITEITRVRYALYTRPDHPLAHRQSVSLAELTEERVILPEEGSLTQRVVSRALARHRLSIERIISMTTFPVMKDAILQGVGVGPFLENSGTSTDGLVSIPIEEMPEDYPISIVVHRDRARLHLIESFVELTAEYVAQSSVARLQ